MTARTLVAAAAVALAVLASLAGAWQWRESESVLTVYLNCDPGVSGTLSVTAVPQSGQPGRRERFDLDTSCRAGKMAFRGYLREQGLRWVLARSDGTTAEAVSNYGDDIQSERDGFYLVLKLTNTLPFITNDRI